MTDRRQQILQEAVDLVAASGYDKLTMRAVARASGMKLGALQYHFRTRDDLLRALAAYIAEMYHASFETFQAGLPEDANGNTDRDKDENTATVRAGAGVRDLVQFLVDDAAGHSLKADRLFPQLWAMSLVEPIMEELMDNLYDEYLNRLAEILGSLGVQHPQAEAIAIMAMVDGLTLFVGDGRRWAAHRLEVSDTVFDFIDKRYGGTE